MRLSRGKPMISVRMPKATIRALQQMAADNMTTTSDIIRQLVEDELTRSGYSTTDEEIDGQVTID